jgi:hypothetical protein
MTQVSKSTGMNRWRTRYRSLWLSWAVVYNHHAQSTTSLMDSKLRTTTCQYVYLEVLKGGVGLWRRVYGGSSFNNWLLNPWETIGTDRARGVDWTTEATNTDSKDYESSKQDACIFKGSDEKRRDYQEINTTTQAMIDHRCRSNSAPC